MAMEKRLVPIRSNVTPALAEGCWQWPLRELDTPIQRLGTQGVSGETSEGAPKVTQDHQTEIDAAMQDHADSQRLGAPTDPAKDHPINEDMQCAQRPIQMNHSKNQTRSHHTRYHSPSSANGLKEKAAKGNLLSEWGNHTSEQRVWQFPTLRGTPWRGSIHQVEEG